MDELIVLCDGTGDSPEAVNRSRTNVQILREALGIGYNGQRAIHVNHKEGWEIDEFIISNDTTRLVYYDRGLGSPASNNNPLPYFQDINAQLTAVGITDNIKQAYKFLATNYKPGDKIYLFGFSRGAYTQRLLTTMLHYIGLLDKAKFANEAELDAAIDQGFALYNIDIHPNANPKVLEFRKKCHPSKELVHFLGLWDTVRGMVSEEVRQNAKLSDVVKTARHALAIDEERTIFKPELWIANDNVNSKQVWFSGVHCDIGGGYKERDLANIPLRWMTDEASKVGLKIDTASMLMFQKNPLAMQHDSLNAPINYKITWLQLTGKIRRPVLQTTTDESIDPSVFKRFGQTVKKGNDNIVYQPSTLSHTLISFCNFQKQDLKLLEAIKIPEGYKLDDVGENTNLTSESPVDKFTP